MIVLSKLYKIRNQRYTKKRRYKKNRVKQKIKDARWTRIHEKKKI